MRPPSIHYARSLDGTRIAFSSVGRGLPIVLCPSPTTHIQAEWQTPQLRGGVAALAERYRVIRYDRRGAGLSERDVQDYSLAARVGDLSAVVDRLELQRFVLAGQPHSLPEAVTFAVRHPTRVARLVLLSAHADGALYERSPRFRYIRRSLSDDWETASLNLAGVVGGWQDAEEMRAHAAIMRDTTEPQGLAALFQQITLEDVTEALGQLQMGVLVVYPRRGPFFTAEDASRMASLIPDARLSVVDAHASPLLGTAAEAVDVITSFLSDLDEHLAIAAAAAGEHSPLSRREIEVLMLVATGLENTAIADRLFISVNTVTRHLTHIYRKTGTTNRVTATRYAIEHQLTE